MSVLDRIGRGTPRLVDRKRLLSENFTRGALTHLKLLILKISMEIA